MPGFYCNAAFKVTYIDSKKPETKAEIVLDAQEYDVYKGEKFADGLCTLSSIESKGLDTGKVKLVCHGKYFELSLGISKTRLSINGAESVYEIGQQLPITRDDATLKTYLVGVEKFKHMEDEFIVLVSTDKALDDTELQKKLTNFIDNTKDVKNYESMKAILEPHYGFYAFRKGIAFNFPDGNKAQITFSGFENVASTKYSDDFKQYFDKSVSDYQSIQEVYGGEKVDSDLHLGSYVAGQKSLEEAFDLAKETGQNEKALELANIIKDNYNDASYLKDINSASGIYSSKASYIFELDRVTHVVELRSIQKPSIEDLSIKITIDNNPYYFYDEGESVIDGEGDNKNDKNEFKLVSFDIDKVKITGDCASGDGKTSRSTKTADINLNQEALICGKKVAVKEINLKKQARIKLEPIDRHVGSIVNISYAIGIEKRAIKLSPEKALERIERLNETIAKWENINNKLGEAVKVMKGACFATSAALQIKNLFSNMGGKAIARQQVMQGDNGWNQLCDEAMASGGTPSDKLQKLGMKYAQYASTDDCLRQNSNQIDKDVKFYSDLIEQQNKDTKERESNAVVESGIFGGKSVDSGKAFNLNLNYLKDKYGKISDSVSITNSKGEIETVKVSESINNLNSEFATSEDLQKIELLMRVKSSSDASATVKAKAEQELYN